MNIPAETMAQVVGDAEARLAAVRARFNQLRELVEKWRNLPHRASLTRDYKCTGCAILADIEALIGSLPPETEEK